VLKPAHAAEPHSLTALLAQLEDLPFVDAARALVKAGFLLSNRPGAPYHAYGLNLAQADVLVALAWAEESGLKCSEIAERTLITKGGITKILDRLEARGLIRRVPSREDRRSISIQLSAKGIELCREFLPETWRGNREIFERAFRPQQMKQFSKLLMLLLRSLEADNTNARMRVSEHSHGNKRV
jgi:MarR family transcriptional regulator, 2-MHQ and catechol-resistance regulon repressor